MPIPQGGLASFLLVAALSCLALQPALGAPGKLPEGARPANVPAEFLPTPNGYFHPSCIHEIKHDEVIAPGRVIEQANGSKRQLEKCNYSNFSRSGKERKPGEAPIARDTMQDGWQMHASYWMPQGEAVSYMAAQWMAPPNPTADEGQTVYFFLGTEQGVTLLQPVLGWNQLNIKGWTLASWNCCEDGTTTHSPPLSMDPTSTIQGKIYFDQQLNGYYVQTFKDPFTPQQQVTQLATRSYSQPMILAHGAVMETYGVTACASLPSAGVMSIQFIDVRDMSGAGVTTKLQPTIQYQNCNYGMVVSNDPLPFVYMTWSNQ